MKLLFLALGEWETPLFRRIAADLPDGWSARLACLLPRLAEPDDYVLSAMTPSSVDTKSFAGAVADRFPTPGYVAHYDREWYRASWIHKHEFACRIGGTLNKAVGEWGPDLVVSSIGGETPRIALDVLANELGIRRAYFNAIPLPGRHVILGSLDAPFVNEPDHISTKVIQPEGDYATTREKTPVDPVAEQTVTVIPPIADSRHRLGPHSVVEAVQRVLDTRPAGSMYPRGWPIRKAREALAFAARQAYAEALFGQVVETDRSTLLYPMHDEQDFQVAMRERHAIPQVAFLEYVSSTIPSSWQIRVRLHPAHRGAVAIRSLRRLAALPNVHVDASDSPIEAALKMTTAVLTLASSVGFDALRAGVPVICYGRPFYSGRGLTADVDDPRLIASRLTDGGMQGPDPKRLACFLSLCRASSFPGPFMADAVADPGHLVSSLRNVAQA